MYKLFIIANLLVISFQDCIAQTASEKLPMSPTDNTLLWEVSGNGLEQPSYFLGTMHILCPEDAYLSDAVLQILDKAKAVYLELDLDNMAQMLAAMKAMTMRNDTTLADLLSEAELEQVKEYFEGKMPLPFAVLQRYKPMLLSGMVAEQMLPCKAGSGSEMLLMQEARKRKLSTEGLETMAYQAGLFDSIPYEQQARELLKALQGANEESDVVEKMLSAYQKQDLKALETLTISEEGGMAEHLELLLFNRNRNWAAQFGEIAAQGTHLFAVGAGHLPGENGVLKLLEKQGYQLRPLLNEKPQ